MNENTSTIATMTTIADEPPVEVPEAFHVHDAATANWVVRKITESRQYAQRVKEWAATEVRRAEHEEQFMLFRFGPQLEQWARRELEVKHGRRKSICLPAGKAGFRTRQIRLEIQDEQIVLNWCKQNLPKTIIVKESLSKTVILEHIEVSGEIPPGCDVSGGEEAFYVG
jgi:phage host-nuclease inhibitor protein Gam